MKAKPYEKFTADEVNAILDALEKMYPDAECELNFGNMFELLVAVVLSAQTTDRSVNKATPALFGKYPDARSIAEAGEDVIPELEGFLRSIGMYKQKARNVYRLSCELTGKYGGEVPDDYDALVSLPGVGRKTANVVLSVGFGHQRIAVDTHVFRVAGRIGLADEKDVLATELALMEAVPEERWSRTHHSLIFHGRYCCSARNPNCGECAISGFCRMYRENGASFDKGGKNGR